MPTLPRSILTEKPGLAIKRPGSFFQITPSNLWLRQWRLKIFYGPWYLSLGHFAALSFRYAVIFAALSLVIGHWSVVFGQWSLVIGQWSVKGSRVNLGILIAKQQWLKLCINNNAIKLTGQIV
jgi:hypothetical protein